jgi:hypothetical protein
MTHAISGSYCDARNHAFGAGASKKDVDMVISHLRTLLSDPKKRLGNNLTCTGIDIVLFVYESQNIIDFKVKDQTKHFMTLGEFDFFLDENLIPH